MSLYPRVTHTVTLILENETRILLHHPLLDFTNGYIWCGAAADIELPQKCHFGGKYKLA